MSLKEYKDTITYVTTILVIFLISFFYSPYRHTDIWMAVCTSGIYGFVAGSFAYFGYASVKKRTKRKGDNDK